MRTTRLRKVKFYCRDVEVPGDCNGGRPRGFPWQGGTGSSKSKRPPHPPSNADATMAKEQPSLGDLLPMLETSDLQQLDEIRGIINEQLSAGTPLRLY